MTGKKKLTFAIVTALFAPAVIGLLIYDWRIFPLPTKWYHCAVCLLYLWFFTVLLLDAAPITIGKVHFVIDALFLYSAFWAANGFFGPLWALGAGFAALLLAGVCHYLVERNERGFR